MKNSPLPGLSVRRDCLEPLGLSVPEAALKSTAEPDIETGVTVNPVQPEPGSGFTVDPKPSINHLRAGARRRRRLKILIAYPEDWIRDRRSSLCLSSLAVKAG